MTQKDIKSVICALFLGGDQSFPIEADTQLLEEGICDSLGLVQVALQLEKRCPGLVIQDQDIVRDNFGSIAAIQHFVAGRRG